jgi:DNA phosphorothioation-associated putative methyltransferase
MSQPWTSSIPLLRLYEGCASRTIGRPEEATVVKFHVQKPQITYLFYPEFDKEPHPALHTSMAIGLQDLHVRYRDYDPDNPPLLHQKDQTVLRIIPITRSSPSSASKSANGACWKM